MKLKEIKFMSEENGSALLLFAFSFLIIIGMAGIVIDMGVVYNAKSHLKKTANAAVLSGAQELLNGDESINKVVRDILKAHGEEENLKDISIKPNNEKKLRIVLEKNVPLYFLKLFRIDSIRISESSSSIIAPMIRAKGAVPLGINENIPLEYMQEYKLKVDSGDSSYGNFGILALTGPGAKLYEQDLMYGYGSEIKVGDVISTETGNVEGKTRDAVNFRINSSPYPVDDLSYRDSSRIILILVYKPYDVESNQLKQVKITGFAYFYIKSPMGPNDSSITGYFIRRTGTGFGDEVIPDKGAYAIRLTE